ncbi:MAG: tripartite tricarboxylate transporter substrate-binding protein [Beijerinckiaceae bacterium]|nr:tripartite tricarboxylate transporter substrate-binding protein [Beijerinckiaceae bacterium]
MKRSLATMTLASLITGAPALSWAQNAADFLKEKRVTLFIGSSTGGGTDAYGRAVASFIGRHIPGAPNVIVSNVPGANGLVVANQLYNSMPKDGTAIATFDRAAALHAIWKNPRAQFIATELNWIGSANIDTSTCVTWGSSGIDTLQKFMSQEVVLGSTAVYHANMLNSLFGAKLKQVTGYPGGNDVLLALERGEVQGRCNWSYSSIINTRPAWVKEKKINVIIQFADEKHPQLQDVPLITELVQNERQKQMIDLVLTTQLMARPFALPPGVPTDRVDAIRKAFNDTMTDPAFLEMAKTQQLEIEPVKGARIQENVQRVSTLPAALIREMRDVVLGAQASAAMDKVK